MITRSNFSDLTEFWHSEAFMLFIISIFADFAPYCRVQIVLYLFIKHINDFLSKLS